MLLGRYNSNAPNFYDLRARKEQSFKWLHEHGGTRCPSESDSGEAESNCPPHSECGEASSPLPIQSGSGRVHHCIPRLLHLALTRMQSFSSLHPLPSLTLGQMYNLSLEKLHPASQLLVNVDQALWPKNSHLNWRPLQAGVCFQTLVRHTLCAL